MGGPRSRTERWRAADVRRTRASVMRVAYWQPVAAHRYRPAVSDFRPFDARAREVRGRSCVQRFRAEK